MLNQIKVEVVINSKPNADDLWCDAIIQFFDQNVTSYKVEDVHREDYIIVVGITYYVDCYNTSINDSDETVGRDVANRVNANLQTICDTYYEWGFWIN